MMEELGNIRVDQLKVRALKCLALIKNNLTSC